MLTRNLSSTEITLNEWKKLDKNPNKTTHEYVSDAKQRALIYGIASLAFGYAAPLIPLPVAVILTTSTALLSFGNAVFAHGMIKEKLHLKDPPMDSGLNPTVS